MTIDLTTYICRTLHSHPKCGIAAVAVDRILKKYQQFKKTKQDPVVPKNEKNQSIIAFQQPLLSFKAQGHGIMVIITKLGLLPPNIDEVNTFLIPTLLPQDIKAT